MLADMLHREHGVSFAPSTLWRFLDGSASVRAKSQFGRFGSSWHDSSWVREQGG